MKCKIPLEIKNLQDIKTFNSIISFRLFVSFRFEIRQGNFLEIARSHQVLVINKKLNRNNFNFDKYFL